MHTTRARLNGDDIDEFSLRNHDGLYSLAFDVQSYRRVRKRTLAKFALTRLRRDGQAAAQTPIHLNGHHNFLSLGRLFVIRWPRSSSDATFVPGHLPQLLSSVRREWG